MTDKDGLFCLLFIAVAGLIGLGIGGSVKDSQYEDGCRKLCSPYQVKSMKTVTGCVCAGGTAND